MEEMSKQIVRVHPSVFKKLPKTVVEELVQRECTIPQLGEIGRKAPRKLSNVISGEFQKPGQVDWAVVCSIDGKSAILVFWKGSAEEVDTIGKFSPDTNSIYPVLARDNKTGYRYYDSYSYILPADKEDIESDFNWPEGPQPPIDHQGIEKDIGKVSKIFYWYEGKWLTLHIEF